MLSRGVASPGKTRRSRATMSPLGAVGRGLIAGAAGPAAMDLLWFWRYTPRATSCSRSPSSTSRSGNRSGPVRRGLGRCAAHEPDTSRSAHQLQRQLAELLGPLARRADLLPRIGAFNLGGQEDYRVPDGGLHRPGPHQLYYSTAALVVEIVSPGDESWEKLAFYAKHDVDELLIVDPQERQVHWLALGEGGYRSIERSALIELGPDELAAQIDWP